MALPPSEPFTTEVYAAGRERPLVQTATERDGAEGRVQLDVANLVVHVHRHDDVHVLDHLAEPARAFSDPASSCQSNAICEIRTRGASLVHSLLRACRP